MLDRRFNDALAYPYIMGHIVGQKYAVVHVLIERAKMVHAIRKMVHVCGESEKFVTCFLYPSLLR